MFVVSILFNRTEILLSNQFLPVHCTPCTTKLRAMSAIAYCVIAWRPLLFHFLLGLRASNDISGSQSGDFALPPSLPIPTPTQGHFQYWKTVLVVMSEGRGGEKARDTTKHPTKHRTIPLHPAPVTKIYPAQTINTTEVEKPWTTWPLLCPC